MPGIFAFMGWDPQTPLRGRKGGFTPPYSYTYLFTGIRYNLRNAIKNGDVVKKFWNLLFLIPKTYKKHGKVVSCLENFFNPRDSSGQLCRASDSILQQIIAKKSSENPTQKVTTEKLPKYISKYVHITYLKLVSACKAKVLPSLV